MWRRSSRVDADGYLTGARAELVFEVAASSASLDWNAKLRVYRRAGVLEYLGWRTIESQVRWLLLQDEEYRPNPPDSKGSSTSRTFPGLSLDVRGLLALDTARVLHALEANLGTARTRFRRSPQRHRKAAVARVSDRLEGRGIPRGL